MDIILLQRVKNLGQLGERVNVKSGYGRNYLIPQGYAVSATPKNIEAFEARRAELERAEAEKLAGAEARKAALEGIVLTMYGKAGDEGKLFGSVGPRDIAEALAAKGVQVDKTEVRMHHGAIRHIGEFSVDVVLHHDVVAVVPVVVEPAN